MTCTELLADLPGIEAIVDPDQIAKLSQDYYYFSPILQPLFEPKRGDLVLRPANEAEVLQIAEACVQRRLPLTVRGAGTGNYGQAVPLEGGVILDMTRMSAVKWVKPGLACVEPGAKMAAIDRITRPQGWELRMAPSTYRTATIGGFVGGGSGGIGSINYGQLRDRGNLHAVRVVTFEDEPRVVTLQGSDVYQVAHAYGTNGIITELQIPLAPAYDWAEAIVTFDDFLNAGRFGQALGDADGIVKKLISVFADPIPQYFSALQRYLPKGQTAVLVMVAAPSLDAFRELVAEFNGTITYEKTAEEATKGVSIWEYTWNHTTLHARIVDPNLTYLQTLFPGDQNLDRVAQMTEYFGDEIQMHLEFLRVGGRSTPAALQLVRFTTAERLQEIIDYHEANGAIIFNPHTHLIEDGGMKHVDLAQLEFKQKMDPYGLLNPGKMRAWLERKQ
ncbi:MAG: FAD-binding oxidoreductase [Alkalinema sp. RU_4_3]|nr:FAD-binding oxidoreductase [Alkalinema sp. RU_4_3]